MAYIQSCWQTNNTVSCSAVLSLGGILVPLGGTSAALGDIGQGMAAPSARTSTRILMVASTGNSLDAYAIPVIGCGPSQWSDSRTACSQADLARAKTRNHERTIPHQLYAEGNASRIVTKSVSGTFWMRSHLMRHWPDTFGDRLSVRCPIGGDFWEGGRPMS